MTAPDRTSAGPPDERLALLTRWVQGPLGLAEATLAPASADASFRRYFRVTTPGRTYIAMDAPPDREDVGPFLKVAGLMATTGINVPAVVAEDRGAGFLLLGDLGSTQYQGALESADAAGRAALYGDAAAALLQLQSRGQAAAAELLPYGLALLDREMQLFPDWFLGRHLGHPPDAAARDALELVFARLAAAALEQPQVFVHRDYHSRNLMVCEPGRPGILDFQDAVRGAVTYDLVSLYKDCYLRWPRADVLAWVEAYRVAAVQARVIPRDLDAAAFLRHFDLMGAQRHLKVLGIFARLWWRDGKPAYLHDLPRVLDYVLEVLPLYPELAPLRPLFEQQVVPAFAAAQERAHAQALAPQRAAAHG